MSPERRKQLQYAIVAMIPTIRFGMRLAKRYPTEPTTEDIAKALEAMFQDGGPPLEILEDPELEEAVLAFANTFREKLDRQMSRPRTSAQQAAAAQDLAEKAKKLAKALN